MTDFTTNPSAGTYSGMRDRTPEYWAEIVANLEKATEHFNSQLQALSHPRRVDFLCTTRSQASPHIRAMDDAIVQIEFPEGFFVWTDEAAKFMHGDVPYRKSIGLCQARPKEDHSVFFHLMWDRWIAYHEISHFLCGHLHQLQVTQFTEFEAVPGRAWTLEERLLRQSMEVDADVFAAQLFFENLGMLSLRGDWDDIYGLKNCATLLMQDIALIFLPLFMEMGEAEPSEPSQRTHPSAMDRLTLFHIFGLTAYARIVGDAGPAHLGAYWAGMKQAVHMLHRLDGTILRRPIQAANFLTHKSVLLAAGVHRRRVVRIPNDWLSGH